MKFSLLLSLSLFSARSLSLNPPLAERQVICSASEQPILKLYISTTLVSYPVFINTYVSANTIININGGVTININNAPTQLSTTISATSTSTITSTVTSFIGMTTSDVEPAAATPILLTIRTAGSRKRQISGSFVGPNGTITDDCTAASAFTLQAGQLFSNGNIVSTGVNTTRMAFGASPILGSVNTTFQASGSSLTWVNALFSGGEATFCLLGSVLEVIFRGGLPVGCDPQFLDTVPASACFGQPTTTLVGTTTMTSTITSRRDTATATDTFALSSATGAASTATPTPVKCKKRSHRRHSQ
ncbi:hypothetical protein PVAG01_04805 [Phlyctema vagabunda]|uniref:DUF7908 domain-containing protein n=1 Tax=Phlyctema vagabunda TaxID=108571 RepID=A0ABR4PIA2_9HELO